MAQPPPSDPPDDLLAPHLSPSYSDFDIDTTDDGAVSTPMASRPMSPLLRSGSLDEDQDDSDGGGSLVDLTEGGEAPEAPLDKR